MLHPGDVLTLTAKLVTPGRPAPGTAVGNNVVATSDRIFDQCQHTHNNQSAPNQSNVGSCAADTVTEPSAASPIRSVKSVKAAEPASPAQYPTRTTTTWGHPARFGSSAGQCIRAERRERLLPLYPCVPITRRRHRRPGS